jgi:hypothetical protein
VQAACGRPHRRLGRRRLVRHVVHNGLCAARAALHLQHSLLAHTALRGAQCNNGTRHERHNTLDGVEKQALPWHKGAWRGARTLLRCSHGTKVQSSKNGCALNMLSSTCDPSLPYERPERCHVSLAAANARALSPAASSTCSGNKRQTTVALMQQGAHPDGTMMIGVPPSFSFGAGLPDAPAGGAALADLTGATKAGGAGGGAAAGGAVGSGCTASARKEALVSMPSSSTSRVPRRSCQNRCSCTSL